MQNYCFTDAQRTLIDLHTSRSGLDEAEVKKRLKTHGKNSIERKKSGGIIKLFISQFKDYMTALLIIAAAASGVIAYISKDKNDLTDTVIILAIIFLNAVVGTVQSYRADKAIESLKKLSVCKSKVRRNGIVTEISSEELTVGDIVLLEEGDIVPADCRVISSNNLCCDESALTGESEGVLKDSERILKNSVKLGEMKNTVFCSTYVVRGKGEGVVVAVGMETETGKIAKMLSEQKAERTPLEKSLDKLGKIITAFVLAVTAVIFILGLCFGNEGILKNFMTSVAIAVAAIPEGLPAVVTIIMAMGVQRMSRKNVVIKKLQSVETLGGCSVICTDKTGTLTENKMRVVKAVFAFNGESESQAAQDKFLECAISCNDVRGEKGNYLGDPTEVALRIYVDERGFLKSFEKLDELPFTSERKLMSVAARFSGDANLYVKGAPDVIIKRCTMILTAGGVRALTAADKADIIRQVESFSAEALRVLGFAYKRYTGKSDENGLTFIGICGMRDPLKQGVAQAVASCKQGGIKTVMITGDHACTAFAIAKAAGITNSESEVTTGDEIDEVSGRERDNLILKSRVFARVAPKHKNLIVQSYKARGEVVAMTGDGVNDAPAIKCADIGVAMGRSGTDVTRGAADMVIADDNFKTIVSAVREGRRISANVKKTIKFFISTNLAEVLAILIAAFAFVSRNFLLSTQLLWLNLITDSFPVLAMGVEKDDDDIMRRAPERAEKIFNKSSLISIAFYGIYITAVTLAAYAIGYKFYGEQVASALAFLTITFAELFQAFNVRSEKSFFKSAFENKVLLATVCAGILINLILAISPLSDAFGLSGLNVVQWVIAFALGFSIILAGEAYKLISNIKSSFVKKNLKEAALRN